MQRHLGKEHGTAKKVANKDKLSIMFIDLQVTAPWFGSLNLASLNLVSLNLVQTIQLKISADN